MKKNSASLRNSGAYTSPGTPEYGENNVGGIPKGWCSERVPLPANSSRRHISASALMPFNSGRAFPSKWDDAERWITSPISSYGVCKTAAVQPQRRPKSKSGPLGPPGVMYLSNYSPSVPVLEGGNVKNFMTGSPFTTGVLVADGLSIQCGGGIGPQSGSLQVESSMGRLSNLPGWSDLLSESSLPSSQDDKIDGTKDVDTMVSPVILRRDMATQMSPEGSTHPSPKERKSFSTSPPAIPPAVDSDVNTSTKVQIRDVQVDKGATLLKNSRKHGLRRTKKGPTELHDLVSYDIAEAAKNTSKTQREEAKITAWENLQKAKAEAAIRKLEMKLEKKRSASMDKILNRLRDAQMKAQEMRSTVSESQAHQVSRSSQRVVFSRKIVKIGFLHGCFSCHAF